MLASESSNFELYLGRRKLCELAASALHSSVFPLDLVPVCGETKYQPELYIDVFEQRELRCSTVQVGENVSVNVILIK